MMYRVVYQPVQIWEAEACQEGEQGCSRGSSCGGSTSSSPGIRAGIPASVRPWTRHSGGDRGEDQEKQENPKNQRRTGSTMVGQSRSIDRRQRVKAKEAPGKVPWGRNDDRKKETDKGRKGQNQVMSRADKVQ